MVSIRLTFLCLLMVSSFDLSNYNSVLVCRVCMEDLVGKLIRSVEPKQQNVAPKMFTFFTSSKEIETNIPLEKILAILITESDISKEEDEIEFENSEYNQLKSYLSYLTTKYSNGKSTERVSILFKGLDKLQTVSVHCKLAMLKSLLLLSESGMGTTNYNRPNPLPYSNGTQTFSLYTDDYFDNIPSKNQMLYSNTSQLENIGSNLSLDSGYFSLPSLPSTRDKKLSETPDFHSVLSKYSGNKIVCKRTGFSMEQDLFWVFVCI